MRFWKTRYIRFPSVRIKTGSGGSFTRKIRPESMIFSSISASVCRISLVSWKAWSTGIWN